MGDMNTADGNGDLDSWRQPGSGIVFCGPAYIDKRRAGDWKNTGDADANNISCNVKVNRPYLPDIMDSKTYEFNMQLSTLTYSQSYNYNFSFSDIAYSGCCMFDVFVTITYLDNHGKSKSKEEYYNL